MKLAIDASITSTGIYLEDQDYTKSHFYTCLVNSRPKIESLKEIKNIIWLDIPQIENNSAINLKNRAKNIVQQLPDFNITQIIMEGPSYNSRSKTKLELHTFQQLLQIEVQEKYTEAFLTIIQPSQLKKRTCNLVYQNTHSPDNVAGGRFTKKEMLDAFLLVDSLEIHEFQKWILEKELDQKKTPTKPIDDLVDAYFLAKIC